MLQILLHLKLVVHLKLKYGGYRDGGLNIVSPQNYVLMLINKGVRETTRDETKLEQRQSFTRSIGGLRAGLAWSLIKRETIIFVMILELRESDAKKEY